MGNGPSWGWDFSNPHFLVLTHGQDRGIPQDLATSQTRLESQCLEKCDPVGHPCMLMGSSRDKWPLSALGEMITHPSEHTGPSVPAVKGANTLQMRQAVLSALELSLYQGMVSSGEGCQELYPCFFCVVFSVNQLSPRKHYTNVTSPRYPTIKPLESLTQTFSSSLRTAESTPR